MVQNSISLKARDIRFEGACRGYEVIPFVMVVRPVQGHLVPPSFLRFHTDRVL